jgi:GMP synthase (glutamine-hydrolysing)
MKPFLVLQLRPEAAASDNEYQAILKKAALDEGMTRRIRLESENIAANMNLEDYSGVIVGGGPGCISDPEATKSEVEKKIESAVLGLMPKIVSEDIPFLGCCYGISILAHFLGAPVGKERFGEPVSVVQCQIEPDGFSDPLLEGVPETFDAFVGHKEAVQELPNGCVHLVSSQSCPFQMLRFGENVYATQFHPEADGDVFELRIRIYKDKGYFHPEEADALITKAHEGHPEQMAKILKNFVSRYTSV